MISISYLLSSHGKMSQSHLKTARENKFKYHQKIFSTIEFKSTNSFELHLISFIGPMELHYIAIASSET